MKEEKPWSEMTEEEWKVEKERIRKIQERHYHSGTLEKESIQKTFE